jgi:hypothetical protein
MFSFSFVEHGSEIKTKENQICHRSEDQSLSSMDPDKGL